MVSGLCICPACGKDLAPKTINQHTEKCADWIKQFGAPFPYLKFSRNLELYRPDSQEGLDYVRCRECLMYGWDFRFRRLIDHLKCIHKVTEGAYLTKHPGAPIRLLATLEKRKASTCVRYGVENVFQAESIKAASKLSMLDNYGVDHPMHCPEIRKRATSTNLQRYGASNPFASIEIKARIRQSNLDRFGVESPNQNPGVFARRLRTNLERYGCDHYFETTEFREKFEATSRSRFGTPHPMQSEEGRRKYEDAFAKSHGVQYPFQLASVQAKAQDTSRANHGGHHHLSDPAIIEARKKHLFDLYGVDNISKVPFIKEKIVSILLAKEECDAVPEMNGLERSLSRLLPDNVVYTGDWTYWVTWSNGRRKNPDFVVLTPEQLGAYRSGVPIKDLRTHLVIEVNGDLWHTSHKGLTRVQREEEFVNGYASVGVCCLIIWESDLKSDPDEVLQRLRGFIPE